MAALDRGIAEQHNAPIDPDVAESRRSYIQGIIDREGTAAVPAAATTGMRRAMADADQYAFLLWSSIEQAKAYETVLKSLKGEA